MAKYRVLQTSFIGNKLVQPGEIVDHDGEAGENLQKLTSKQALAADNGESNDAQNSGEPLV